ncbi:glycosyltransferase [Colidextribacter sp. OB.20]|uniref:glycosyltransferase family 32 protein n=1 Tax=Colidextribacter sp. OB.20 TaxID=2304568 RepID=UPI00136E07D9|nr:glycosyltransferase [Colidextribacter sp. OB.20]
MRRKKGSFEDFFQRVMETGKQVILYGAGVIGQVAAPYWITQYQLEDRVICYVDADSCKQGQTVRMGNREIPICALSTLDEKCGQYILLVTVSAFEPVAQALEQIPGTCNAEVYFLPIMLLDIAHAPKSGGVIKSSQTQLIPKKIHYCWFGENSIPTELQKCMDSWKRFCPDYEIVRWDESSYDIHKTPYMEQAYAHKKWGFVSDFARLDILYQHGGIYLDTDVELLRNLDELLYQPAFCSIEKWGTIASGGGAGAQAGNPVIKAMLDFRSSFSFLREDGAFNQTACGYYETIPLLSMGLRLDGTTQEIAGGMMTVYSSDFFLPFDYISGKTNLTKNTFSIHHYSGSWLEENAAAERLKTRQCFETFRKTLED